MCSSLGRVKHNLSCLDICMGLLNVVEWSVAITVLHHRWAGKPHYLRCTSLLLLFLFLLSILTPNSRTSWIAARFHPPSTQSLPLWASLLPSPVLACSLHKLKPAWAGRHLRALWDWMRKGLWWRPGTSELTLGVTGSLRTSSLWGGWSRQTADGCLLHVAFPLHLPTPTL